MAHVSPGTVRGKTFSWEPLYAGKCWTGPGMRLVAMGVLTQDGGGQEALSEALQTGVACLP